MTTSNRRVGRPKLPRGVEDAADRERPRVDEKVVEVGPVEVRAPSRAATIARAVLGAALVIGVSGSAAYGARRYVTTTPRFAVKEVVVTGNVRRSADDVANVAGITKGANVFSLDLERARARLMSDPWIHDASLVRRLPGTVSIQVTEREAAAVVALGDSYLASRDGEIFKRLEPGDPTDLPVVTGLSPDVVAEDRPAAVLAVPPRAEMNFVDRDGLAPPFALGPRLHISVVGPGEIIGVGDDRGGRGPQLRLEAERVGFQRLQLAARRDDLVLVDRPGADVRDEDLPQA